MIKYLNMKLCSWSHSIVECSYCLTSMFIQLINVGDSLISSLSFSNPVYQSIFHLPPRGMHSIAFTQEDPIRTKGKLLFLLSQLLIAMRIGNISWASFGELGLTVWFSANRGACIVPALVPALHTTSSNFPCVSRLMKFPLLLCGTGSDAQGLHSVTLTGGPPGSSSDKCNRLWMTFPF